MKVFLDTETCGLHGVAVIVQYAYDDGPIAIHHFWQSEIDDSLALIEKFCECEVIGFNLAFDWFHLAKLHTLLTLAKAKFGGDAWPEDHIEEIAALEERARDGRCVKPFKALDLMLHARKTEFQITMNRGDIRIRKVPTGLAWSLAKKLEEKIKLDSILFARKKNPLAAKWVVHDIEAADGEINPDFKDVVLKFKPSVALKALALHVLNIPPEEIISFVDIEVNRAFWPAEMGWAPFAAAYKRLDPKARKKFKKKKPWPKVLKHHITHWAYHQMARDYALKDVKYTRMLYEYFGCPEAGDDDSELACMVGAVRWRGYAVDIPGIMALREEAAKLVSNTPTAPNHVKKWIRSVMGEVEAKMFTGTGKIVLEGMAAKANGEKCPVGYEEYGNADGMICDTPCMYGPCKLCEKTGGLRGTLANQYAEAVLNARKAKKEIELYDKLIIAGRFHASFKVIGALSSRMSGTDGLNPQGIKKTKRVREKFPFAFGKLKLRGGDFAGFEVVLAVAASGDKELEKDLKTCEKCRDVQVIYTGSKKACPKCGGNKTMKIHALFGMHVYPHMTYDEIKATDGSEDDKYTRCKSAVFAMIYGGEAYTLMTRLGVPIEDAEEAYRKFCLQYEGVGIARQRVVNAFCSIRQEGGLGSKVAWNDPAEYVESLTGFKRYFVLENQIVKAIFELAENPPKEWKELKIKVRRRDRDQSIGGAVQSALFGCAFQIQAGNMRAAANHEIQSSGATITKHVQRKIWDVQPHGVNDWLVQPMNVHDAIYTPTDPVVDDVVNKAVFDAVESFRAKVPLIEFEYKPMQDWSSK